MDVVLDSNNVWVSGLLWRGTPWQILRRAEAGDVTLWATPSIIQEVQQTLNYPRLQPRRRRLNFACHRPASERDNCSASCLPWKRISTGSTLKPIAVTVALSSSL